MAGDNFGFYLPIIYSMGIFNKIPVLSAANLAIRKHIDEVVRETVDPRNVELAQELYRETFSSGELIHDPTVRGMTAGIFRNPKRGAYVVHRNEPALEKIARTAELGRFMESLTPKMRDTIGAVDLRPLKSVSGYAGIGYVRFGDDEDGVTPYHEVAHLLTLRLNRDDFLKEEWEKVAGDVYGKSPSKDWKEMTSRGIISNYSATRWEEDISELVGYIYAKPELVKRASHESGIFAKKIEILHRRGYINDEQYSYLMKDGPLPAKMNPSRTDDASILSYFWGDGESNDAPSTLGELVENAGESQTQG